MRYGVMVLEDYHPDKHQSVSQLYERILLRATEAEALGYDGFWLAEHHFHWWGGAHPAPSIILGAIAARTARIRLGTAVSLLPLHNPLNVAEEAAVIDNLSRGRLELGVGRGFLKIEYDGHAIPMSESRGRFEEGLDILVRALTVGRVSCHGRFYAFEEVELTPKPVQRPHPPIWVAASTTTESFEWIGSRGYHLMVVPYIYADLGLLKRNISVYRDAYTKAGHRGIPEIFAFVHAYISDTDDPRVEVDSFVMAYVGRIRSAEALMRGQRDPKQYPGMESLDDRMSLITTDTLYSDKKALLGNIERCVDIIRFLRDGLGLSYLAIMPSWGGLPEEKVLHTMKVFLQEIVPRVESTGHESSQD